MFVLNNYYVVNLVTEFVSELQFIRRPTGYCPEYVNELERVYSSADYIKVIADYEKVLDYMEEQSGKRTRNLMDVFQLYQTLNAEENMNLTLPNWTDPVYPEPMETLVGKQCEFENYNSVLKRLNGGKTLI